MNRAAPELPELTALFCSFFNVCFSDFFWGFEVALRQIKGGVVYMVTKQYGDFL
ncbi:hypothetical protein D3C77_744340 [compost metagenome]